MAQKDDFNFFFIPATISIFQVQIPRVLLGGGLAVKSPYLHQFSIVFAKRSS